MMNLCATCTHPIYFHIVEDDDFSPCEYSYRHRCRCTKFIPTKKPT